MEYRGIRGVISSAFMRWKAGNFFEICFGSGTYCNYSDSGNIGKWMGGSQTLCPRISRANAYDISAGFQSTGGRTKNTGN